MRKQSFIAFAAFCCTTFTLHSFLSAQTFSWTNLGESAQRKCFSLSAAPDGSMLAGSDSGLFRSYDNGISWQSCGLDSFEIRCAVADSTGRLFVAGGRGNVPNGIYRSDDGGISWHTSIVLVDTLSSNVKLIGSINALLSVSDEILLAATSRGVLRSTDYGNSWSKFKPPGDFAYQSIHSLCKTADGYLYAGGYAAILRSVDQGKTWETKYKTSSDNNILAAGNFGDVFTFSMAQNGHAYLYHTIDQGDHWGQYYPELFEDGVTFMFENGTWVQYGPGYYLFLGIVQDLDGRSFIICTNRNDSVVVMGTNGKIVQSLALENAGSLFQKYSKSLAITPDGHCLIGLAGNIDGGIYRSVNPIASPSIPSIKISQAIVDGDHDLKPDSLGKPVTIVGVVNSTNLLGNEGTQYTLQDGTGGIQLSKNTAGGLILKLGDAVAVTGTIAYERGTTQIIPASFNNSDVKILDSNQTLTITPLTVQQFFAYPEKYESQLVKISGIAKRPHSPAWPSFGADADMVFWDGWDTIIVRIDKDANLSGTPEPIYPAYISGVVTQYSSSAIVSDDGYQISPNNPADFEGGIQVAPNPHFSLVSPVNGATLILDSTSQRFTFRWNKAVDLNSSPLSYRWVPIGGTAIPTGGSPTGADSFLVRTGAQLLTFLENRDTVVLKWTVQTKDPFPAIVSNVDTSFVTLIKGKTLDVTATDNVVPAVFSLDQNYPNPFNPATTIGFTIPAEGMTTLKIYNTLGQEVAILANEKLGAGKHHRVFDASALSSGIYFARLQSGGKVQLKKMMLLK
ncbi:MAG: T9SS type A sorting domain-containing protein [Bacteroidota bacterium]